jgi:tRNA 2-thiocytidine biosynthesis protein TtcA
MIRPGERIAVAVSGGKDSLSLLRLLDWRRGASRDPYDLVAIHVRADARGRETPAHPILESWLRAQGYIYRMAETFQKPGESPPFGCQRCT